MHLFTSLIKLHIKTSIKKFTKTLPKTKSLLKVNRKIQKFLAPIVNSQLNLGFVFSNVHITFFFTRIFPLLLTVYILFRISLNLFNESLWYDEAMQFWISFGSSSDSLKLNSGIWEVVKLNQLYNHDPGGFSIILHLWLKFSQDLHWIRLLPLLFFVASVFTVFLTIQFLFKK